MGGLRAVRFLCPEEAWGGFALAPEIAARERTTPGASSDLELIHGLALSVGFHLFLFGSALLLSPMTPAFSPPTGERPEIPVAVLIAREPEADKPAVPPPPVPIPEPISANPEPVSKPRPAPAVARKPTLPTNRAVSTVKADDAMETIPIVPPPIPPVAAGVPDADMDALFRRYSLTLWERIAAQKPDRIRLRGTITLRFSLSRDGELIDAGIAQSSGRDDLDQLALDALRAAAPFPAPPPGIGDLSFTVPFRFR